MSQILTHNSVTSSGGWEKRDTEWMLTLFGTAIGAGVLFLPINAGLGGIWPLILMTFVIGPMTFLAHRGLSRLCLSATNPTANITETVREHFGPDAGSLITFCYFASIFPILLIYGIGLTNTVNSLLENQLGLEAPHRSILSLTLVLTMVSVMVAGQKIVLKVTNAIVYPLIAVLFGTSIYLIPQWNTAQFEASISCADFFKTVFLTIPVLVFSFNHSPAISSFASTYRQELGQHAEAQTSKALLRTTLMLVGFTMFFVYSCVLALSPSELLQAKAANLPILSIFAERTENQLFAWLAQVVAIVAIASSFFGHFMGAREGLEGIVIHRAKARGQTINLKTVNRAIIVFITLSVWVVAYLNISVMGMIEALVAPVLALILFILPVYATHKVPAMAQYRSKANIFTVVMGLVAITGFVASQLV